MVQILPLLADGYLCVSTLLNPDRKAPPQAFAMGNGNVGHTVLKLMVSALAGTSQRTKTGLSLLTTWIHRVVEDVEIGADLFWHLARGDWTEHLARGAHRVTNLGIIDAYGMGVAGCCSYDAPSLPRLPP